MKNFNNYKILNNIENKWKWIGNSCWLDTLMINLLSNPNSYFIKKVLNFKDDDKIHYLILSFIITLYSDKYNIITFNQFTREILKEQHVKFFNNETNIYDMENNGSIGSILDLIFRTYNIFFYYWDKSLNCNFLKVTSIPIPKFIDNKKIKIKKYINNYLNLYYNPKMIVFNVSSSYKKGSIPEYININDNEYKFQSATIFDSNHYTSIIYNDNYYYYIDILTENSIYKINTNNFKLINNLELNQNHANLKNNSTFLFYYII